MLTGTQKRRNTIFQDRRTFRDKPERLKRVKKITKLKVVTGRQAMEEL
jgi:hypothetical protein